jgi:L-malate glycosyltransferase
MPLTVNQWVPAAHRGDAIGDSVRRFRSVLQGMGVTSHVYAMTIDEDLQHEVRPWPHPEARDGDVTIFHFALPSAMTSHFASLPRGRVVQYHNITPAHFFARYDPNLFHLARIGRADLVTLVGHVDLALGGSEFNRRELERMGFAPTAVMPVAVDTGRFARSPRFPALEEVLDDGLDNFLFVGRIVPNKKIEDFVRLAELYKRHVNVDCRFLFVGRYAGAPRYYAMIRALMEQLEMPPDRFVFTGPVPEEELATYYRMARVYISLSEHEGFCAPLLEAMAADVPVMAYAAAAIPETLGGAGVQFAPKDLEYAAELLGTLNFDEDVRGRVIEGQRRRIADFSDERTARDLREVIARVT